MDRFKNHFRILTIIAIFTLAWSINSRRGLAAPGAAPALAPLGNAFTYEGRIPATLSGRYDFQFRLFNAASAGALLIGTSAPAANILVQNGEYIAPVNFGVAAGRAFTGDARYLEVRYRTHSTDAAAPYTLLSGARPQLLPVPYAMSLRPGALISGSTDTGAVLGVSNTSTGIGVWGTSKSNAAVYGESTSSTGVVGQGAVAGVLGRSTGGRGVVGTSSRATGVYGETAVVNTATLAGVYGKSTGAGSIGVIGEATGSGNSRGVYGIGQAGAGVVGKASTGIGVSGISTLGYAMESYGHATQRLNSGGWVKAMALIRTDGVVEQCFNSQLAGIEAAASPCGITVTHGQAGFYTVNFGFQVDNRFIAVTPLATDINTIVANVAFDSSNSSLATVRIRWSWRDPAEAGSLADGTFFIFVY